MAANEDVNVEKKPGSTEMLGSMQALENLKLTVTEAINKNKQNFDELSDKLQSIEASIEKISKSNDAENTRDNPSEEQIDEPKVCTNVSLVRIDFLRDLDFFRNTTNVTYEKRFKLKPMFKNVKKFKEHKQNSSEWEDHYNAKWCVCLKRENDHLGFYICCEPIDPSSKWSIRTKLEYKVVGRNQNDVIRSDTFCFVKKFGIGYNDFLKWDNMETWYLVDGNLTVEAKITIIETTGLGKKKIRKFDESQKDVSDVILVVRDTKFYGSKLFLASQSSVFKALLFGNFKESEQSEVKLNGIDPNDFHYFLEVLYGESAIDEINVEDVARLADMYDAPTAIRKCEEFLLEKSKKTIEMKLTIATRYNLGNLEEKCMSEIKNIVSKNSKVSKRNPFRKLLRL